MPSPPTRLFKAYISTAKPSALPIRPRPNLRGIDGSIRRLSSHAQIRVTKGASNTIATGLTDWNQPIGLSMVTKLAPVRLVGLGMGGWFLSTAIGNNLAGLFAAGVSGESGMTVDSALSGYTFGFWILLSGGVLLFLIAPLINKLMHGVR